MSMFNEQCICADLRKDKETKDPDYRKAQDREREEIQKGISISKGLEVSNLFNQPLSIKMENHEESLDIGSFP